MPNLSDPPLPSATDAIRRIVVVGGGTAGWLAACRIAAAATPGVLSVTVVESPDVPTIGVGEGTWPTMRGTLERIGIDEAEFLLACDASFKQGSRFDGWRTGTDRYHHPFSPPLAAPPRDLIALWRDAAGASFADAVGIQPDLADQHFAPRQRAMPGYTGALNYGYHLDAAKLAALLARHATQRLGVKHVRDHVDAVERHSDGDIAAVATRGSGLISGDLFLDCTGHAALLIGGALDVPLVDRSDVLFNDRALAVQVPVACGSAIASTTNATAHAAGWLWDIALPTRRGVGCVYSSAHIGDDAAAETLRAYLRTTAPGVDADALQPRRLSFRSAHRTRFWERNVIALGLAAGFLEPLEASAIVTIELSLDALLDGFPASRAALAPLARRFNALFAYRWDRIVEFLKLHYVLSDRAEPYWQDHRASDTVPPRLAELLALWRDQPPSPADFAHRDEVFPAASWQYVLYGMGWHAPPATAIRGDPAAARRAAAQMVQRERTLAATLPTNRAYLDALVRAAAPTQEAQSR